MRASGCVDSASVQYMLTLDHEDAEAEKACGEIRTLYTKEEEESVLYL